MRRLIPRGVAAGGLTVALLCLPLQLTIPSTAWETLTGGSQPVPAGLTHVRDLAPGISLFRSSDPSVLEPPNPVSIWLLRLDPSQARLRAVLANDEIVGTETVGDTAARHRAVAAVNAGFFLPNGDPAGLFKWAGRLVSDTRRPRGAVAILDADGRQQLLFDRVTASMSVTVHRGRVQPTVPIDGVDTPRARGKLMLFTPSYNEHTGTAPGGLEWTLSGSPLRITAGPSRAGSTPIPRDGAVLSFGGPSAPAGLRSLRRGTLVELNTRYESAGTPAEAWESATDIIGGAGLLARDGKFVDDWSVEEFRPGFAEMRHPRTMIGLGHDRSIWLVTVDGRQPALSAGMTLLELQKLARRLSLTDALNLDGGGSTTMWISGAVVNSPSDAAGPRKVSDALLVFPVPH